MHSQARVIQQCVEGNVKDNDKDALNWSATNNANLRKAIKPAKLDLLLTDSVIKNSQEGDEIQISPSSANCIKKGQQCLFSCEPELKMSCIEPSKPTFMNKARREPRAKIVSQDARINKKPNSNFPSQISTKPKALKWLSRLPLIGFSVDDNSFESCTQLPPSQNCIGRPRPHQPPFQRRQRLKKPPDHHFRCLRTKDWLTYLDFVRQVTRPKQLPNPLV